MNHSEAKIRIENLIKVYGDKSEAALKLFRQGVDRGEILNMTGQVVGIADVSLAIGKGEFFVLMGLSGSGKSTLLRCINRLITPSSGHIYIDDEDIVSVDEKRLRHIRLTQISMVFQHFGLFPHRSIIENVAYGLKVRGISKVQRHRKALDALEVVGLAQWADQKPASLSGGMKQRVGIARALATDADILLMDEPFSALDPLTRREMQDELLRLQKELHKTIVFVSHDTNEALKLGDRIAVMNQGAIVQVGTPEELLNQPVNDYIRGFMQDVNRSHILKAGAIAHPAMTLLLNQDYDQQTLISLQNQQPQRIYVLNSRREPVGFIEPQQLDQIVQTRLTDLTQIMQPNLFTIEAKTALEDIFHLYSKEVMLPVVDETGAFQGVLDQSTVLKSISKHRFIPDPTIPIDPCYP